MSPTCLTTSALVAVDAISIGRGTSSNAAIRLKETPLGCFAGETVDLHPANGVKRAKLGRPNREMVKDSTPELTKEFQLLLKLRLRAAALIMLRKICQGLREAHGIGLIHRDIKPGNLFVAQRGGMYDLAKLLDFGMVKAVAEIPSARLTQEGDISGTPLFMSPEQANGREDLDARSAIYSLAAVAYAMIAGRPLRGIESFRSDDRPRPRRCGAALGSSGRRAR